MIESSYCCSAPVHSVQLSVCKLWRGGERWSFFLALKNTLKATLPRSHRRAARRYREATQLSEAAYGQQLPWYCSNTARPKGAVLGRWRCISVAHLGPSKIFVVSVRNTTRTTHLQKKCPGFPKVHSSHIVRIGRRCLPSPRLWRRV